MARRLLPTESGRESPVLGSRRGEPDEDKHGALPSLCVLASCLVAILTAVGFDIAALVVSLISAGFAGWSILNARRSAKSSDSSALSASAPW
jgi:hypothetical protein